MGIHGGITLGESRCRAGADRFAKSKLSDTYYSELPVYCDHIFASYTPYDKLPAFWEGLETTSCDNPYQYVRSGSGRCRTGLGSWPRGKDAMRSHVRKWAAASRPGALADCCF